MSKRCFVDAKAFSNALKKASKVPKKSSIEILSEVHVQVKDGLCVLTGTDLNTWLSVELPARGDDLAFVFSRTKDVERACRHFDGELAIELIESGGEKNRRLKIVMQCGARSGEFDALLPELYPEKPVEEAETEFSVDAKKLLERVERVRYATEAPGFQTPTARACVQFSGDQIYAVDGQRVSCDTDPGMSIPQPFLAPAEPLSWLKLLDGEQASFQLGKRYIQITDGAVRLLFRRFEDATVFNLAQAIPKAFADEFYVSPKDFLKELAYLKEFSPSGAKPYVRFCGGELLMTSYAGRYRTHVALDGRSEIVFGFDLRHVKDALEQFRQEDQVKIKVASKYAPFVIEAEGRRDFAMVCPVRLKEEQAA